MPPSTTKETKSVCGEAYVLEEELSERCGWTCGQRQRSVKPWQESMRRWSCGEGRKGTGGVRVKVQLKGVSVHVAEVSDFILQGTAVLESPGECMRKTGGKSPSFPTPRKDEKSQTGGVKASEGGLGDVHLERWRRGSQGSQGTIDGATQNISIWGWSRTWDGIRDVGQGTWMGSQSVGWMHWEDGGRWLAVPSPGYCASLVPSRCTLFKFKWVRWMFVPVSMKHEKWVFRSVVCSSLSVRFGPEVILAFGFIEVALKWVH